MKIPTILITDILETRFAKGLASIIEKKMNKSMQEIIKKCEYSNSSRKRKMKITSKE